MDKVSQSSNTVTSPFIPATQGRYLTVPNPLEQHRPELNRRHDKSALCLQACTCFGILFIVLVFVIFTYAIVISKGSKSENTHRSFAEPI